MHLSTDRILTTHVGSLPRPEALAFMLSDQESGKPVDLVALEAATRQALVDIVKRQSSAGIDIGNDGEQSRVSYVTYVTQRIEGFSGEGSLVHGREFHDFPDYAERMKKVGAALMTVPIRRFSAPEATSEIRYGDLAQIDAQCALYDEALANSGNPFSESFMTAASPGVIAFVCQNRHYDSHEAYVFALAREMKKEYDRIHEAGYVLQLDCPDMANDYAKRYWDKPFDDYRKVIETHVAALNEALADIPRDRVRMHICYGNYEGPHTHDPPLENVLPVVYQANVGAIQVEMANPRHAHEHQAIAAVPPPDHIAVIPGVIDSTTHFVEHPQLVAERIEKAVQAVGDRERVIAGCDCGFGTFAGHGNVAPSVVWAKLGSLSEGARIASERLWG